jgi:hypothetical protein
MTIVEYIYLVIAIISAIFAVYLYFRKPQELSESNDRLFNYQLDEMSKTITNLKDNHLHTLQTKLDCHIDENHKYVQEDIKWKSKMETLLDERLPRK